MFENGTIWSSSRRKVCLGAGGGAAEGATAGGGGSGRCHRRCGRSRGAAEVDDLEHVFAGDPTAYAGAGHFCRIDGVVRQELADDRREDQGVCCSIAARRGRCGWCLGGRGCGFWRSRGRGRRCGSVRRLRRRGRWCGRRRGRRWRRFNGLGRCCSRGRCGSFGRGRTRRGVVTDDGQPHTDIDGLAFRYENLGQDAGGRRGHL